MINWNDTLGAQISATTDRGLVRAYCARSGEQSDAMADALLAEIEQ